MNVLSVSFPLTLLHVGAEPAFLEPLAAAARRSFPAASLISVNSVADALAREPTGDELLVLDQPAAADRDQAEHAVDPRHLPRWSAVITRTDDADGIGALYQLSRDAWRPDVLAPLLRAALEQQRLARENARFRGDLATIGLRIAHDLRTPLGGVMTTAEMLHEILHEDHPDKAPLTRPIIDSTEGLVKLIERMSFIAKTAASREPAARFDMLLPFWDAYQQMESALTKAGVSLVQPRDWPAVHGHASAIQVVWRLLIANALAHGGPGVKIEAGWNPIPGGFRFFLRDTGPGVPANKRSLLFHPFERLHEPGAPRGFGLPTVRRLVERDGGRCGYEAPPEGGSVFFFTLPSA